MDFDLIFPFIIMVIWLVGVFRKLFKAEDAEKTAAADQKPGLMKSLMQNLAALEERGKQGEALDISNHFQPAPEPRSDAHEKESIIEMAESSQQQESTISRETPPISPPAVLTKSRASTIRKKSMPIVGRRKLRNAVIWAEILAPPLALRESLSGSDQVK